MRCSNCGNELDGNARFCAKCGADVGALVEQASSEAEAQGASVTPEVPGISKEEYRSAKAAYKQARKDAGKTRTPLVITIIVAILLVAGLSAFGTWYLLGQQEPEVVQEEVVEAPEEEAVLEEESEETTPANPYDIYIGEWTGELDSTSTGFGSSQRCYGAEEEPMVLDIQSISNSGRVTASVTLLYHGHEGIRTSSEVATMTGDAVITLENLTSTFSTSGFSFSAAVAGEDEVTIEVVPKTTGTVTQLTVTVTSEFDGLAIERDVYVLTRAS